MLTVLFTFFFILLFINLPVAFAIGFSSMVALNFYVDLPFSAIVTRMYSGVDSFTLLAIPFFIAAGEIMNESGITDKIVSFSKNLVGHIKGGLAHVSIVSSMFFSGISGSATADASALGSMLIPAMKKSGIDTDFAVAVSASSSAIGPIIPPSILFVIYGSIANVSIAKLFLGGVIPGLLIGFGLMLVTYFYAKKRGYPSEKRSSLKKLFRSFLDSIIALMMPVIILGGIFGGIFTATEAGVVAVFYAIIVGVFIYKKINFSDLGRILIRASITTAIALFVISASSAFAWTLAWEGFGEIALNFLITLSNNPKIILFLILIFVLILGLFVEGIPVLIILSPVMLPVINGLGIDAAYFGVLLVMAIVIGSVTPPVGILTYISCAIANTTVSKVFWTLWPFCGIMILILFLSILFPSLITLFF
jgi:tripartite ATP-independent transporter DctM subunit